MTQIIHEMPQGHTRASGPWWRYGMVWLVIAGPAAVVVAGLFTCYLAVRAPDPVLSGLSTGPSSSDLSTVPAQVGRNHAATGQAPPSGLPSPGRSP
jgi:hypothetical protein